MTDTTDITTEAERIIKAVLGNRQIGFIADTEDIFSQHRQTTGRQYSADPPRFPKPFYNGDRRSWTRDTLKKELIRRMKTTKAA